MSIFKLHGAILNDYRQYVHSFMTISDERIRAFVEDQLTKKNTLWPEPLIQLNPDYEKGPTVEALVSQGKLHPLVAQIFRAHGKSIHLYRHQAEAISKALAWRHFVVTSGTGSGKSLAYLIPIFNAVLGSKPEEKKVRAILVYPMNALVNSQYKALEEFALAYKQMSGQECPVTFAKYTGQERGKDREEILRKRPHLILTNYVMLELMLLRPQEGPFVDAATAGIQFLVLDELHTYRGRQGADVALLIRRLRERCGNPNLLCIGTSATMVAGPQTAADERKKAVADFATQIFGSTVEPADVVEESLQRITAGEPTPEQLRHSISQPLPAEQEELTANSLAAWAEMHFGLEEEAPGCYKRRLPIQLSQGAEELSRLTGADPAICQERLQELFLLKMPQAAGSEGKHLFAFKIHQFFSQGQTVYSTLESAAEREFTLEGRSFTKSKEKKKVLWPMRFCRICGQEYYPVTREDGKGVFYPAGPALYEDESSRKGYLMPAAGNDERVEWDPESIPSDWLDVRGRIKRGRSEYIPELFWVSPDGSFSREAKPGTLKAWFQKKPFLLCLRCGEEYDPRGLEFGRLGGLATEGRSTSTTILTLAAYRNAGMAIAERIAHKILSFTDNRQDASLQAGHLNDFVRVAILRSGIWKALERYGELRYDDIAPRLVEALGLSLGEIARNRAIEPGT
ncbi:MAG: DEAD/DEAH box helicase, partial [bacterium]